MFNQKKLQILQHKIQPISDVYIAGSVVVVEEEEVDVGILLFEFLFDAFGYNLVGNAAKGLYADDVFDALLGE